jgi:hypothetical protein
VRSFKGPEIPTSLGWSSAEGVIPQPVSRSFSTLVWPMHVRFFLRLMSTINRTANTINLWVSESARTNVAIPSLKCTAKINL